ncbi:hypothetical protein DPMN_153893 [Dreissena polymorpha]|uniref:Uncharacterized protein n=1 Tax=Dreissena polymorpha TaxID=45954 RepID=A0A9D4FK53_DREPO|nr:hypothetical protein DPMN_153893 [Dreissena polymorpha]
MMFLSSPLLTMVNHGHHFRPWSIFCDHGNHVPDYVPPRVLTADNQIPRSTIKNHGDHGSEWVRELLK